MQQAPDYIGQAAQARVHDATQQREKVIAAVQAGRPLEAEPSRERLIARMEAVTGVNERAAEALASGEDPDRFGLAGEAKLGAERIQGRTTDFVGVSFLDLARTAASTVARVVRKNLEPEGSGFMIGPNLFMTNNHVIPDVVTAREMLIEFSHELDVDGRPKPESRFALDPQRCFITNEEDDYDFTIVAVGDRIAGNGEVTDFGFCPLIATNDKHVLGEFVNLIQHPDGDYKQLVLRENRLVSRFDSVLQYMADTNPGSSGSPVFNDQWEVIALHHWGEPHREEMDAQGRPLPRDVNEGIRISAIVKVVQDELDGLKLEARRLVEPALDVMTRKPQRPEEGAGHGGRRIPDTADEPETRSLRPHSDSSDSDSTAWTVPLTITVDVGKATRVVSPRAGDVSRSRVPAGAGAENKRPDPNYGNRPGYDPSFLPGLEVPLPKLSSRLKAKAARKIEVEAGEDPYELTYQHFSIVMNAERRLAFLTGSNIDGATWKDIDRKTGRVREESLGAEAREKWYEDPRLRLEHQTDQSLYDNQKPRTFDRGHLVRRQDPSWGTVARALKAGEDTFHFTNCTPQEWRFNEQTRHWQGIEQWILERGTVADGERACVFTGPVLADDDEPYRDVLVPKAFWKVVAFVRDGELHATALLADQSELIERMPERMRRRAEDLADTAEVKSYQVSMKELERLTGLDFGELREHDTFEPGGEGMERGRKRITRFSDVRLEQPAHV